MFVVGHRFGLFKWMFPLLVDTTIHPFVDEAAGAAAFLIAAFLIFSYRRWRESRTEIVSQSHPAQALRRLHGELDLRVKQRTVELRAANDALQAEIAERIKAEEHTELFLAVLRHTNDAIEVIDLETGRYVDVNGKACQERGYSRGEYLAMTVFDMAPDLDHATYAADLERVRNVGQLRFETWHRRKDGSRFPVEVVLSIATRGRDYFVAIVRDITERRRAEARIQDQIEVIERAKSEADAGRQRAQLLLRDLHILQRDQELVLKAIGEGIRWIDREGRIVFENPAAARMLGWVAGERVGQVAHATMHHHRADGSCYPEQECPIFATLHDGQFRHHVVDEVFWRKDGTSFPVEYSVGPLRDDAGDITGAVVVFADISERKQAEARIADALNYSRTMLEASPVAILTYASSGDGVAFNEAAARMIGATVEQLGRQNFRQIESWKDSGMLAAAERALAVGGEQICETHFTTSFGKEMWVSARFVPFAHESSQHLLVMMADISRQRRAEAALREAELKYHSIFDNAAEGIFQSTPEGEFLAVNPALARILGFTSAAELRQARIGVAWLRCANPDDGAKVKRIMDEQGAVPHFEYQTCRKNGDKIWVSENARAVRDASGRVHCYEGTLEDVTALKTLHARLFEVSRRAGMAEVATGVLHNVGNVLNSVNVSSLLVTEKLSNSRLGHLGKAAALLHEHAADLGAFLTDDPRGRQLPGYLGQLAEYLAKERRGVLEEAESLRKNVEHIKDIISMQQSYARVSGVVEPVSVAELVEDTLRMNSAALARHEVEVVRDYDPRGPEIVTEKQKVLQILVNLVRNAKYACDDTGRTDKRITVRVTAHEDGVQLAIIDNGVGIPPENLGRIFNHGFTTRKNGHGFGLHSSALAARELGGTLTAHSAGAGQGATFVLELPRQRP